MNRKERRKMNSQIEKQQKKIRKKLGLSKEGMKQLIKLKEAE